MTKAEAGPRGPQVRSDAWVGLEAAASGAREISVSSKVEALYGDAIRRQMEEGCDALGFASGTVAVEDGGALPFVLAARLEAAWRALPGEKSGRALLPERLPANDGASPRDRLRRSRLYLPGSSPKFFVNAALHRPDGVILDLEDSVAPPEKAAARLLVRNALRFLDWGDAERMVRINPGELGREDVAHVAPHGAQLLLLPKVESAAEVVAVAEECERHVESAACPWLMPILESARGILAAGEIARAHPRVVALTVGLEDYTADLGATRTPAGRESLWARSQVVAAARAAGVQPIDSVFSDVQDLAGLAAAAHEARALGFDGMGCIHPRQIRVVHEAFAPSAEELGRAEEIVAAFEDAKARGLGVVSLGSKMIDAPVVKRAQRTVELARRLRREEGGRA